MKIVRHCRERLPGTERLWRRLAKKAGFSGTLEVIGYGVGNTKEAKLHRKNIGTSKKITLAYIVYDENRIRVFSNGPCTPMVHTTKAKANWPPIASFAHELGHFVLNRDNPKKDNERNADRYARKALRGLGIETSRL